MTRKLAFNSSTSELSKVRSAARDFLEACEFEECDSALLVLALDEACTNIIRHAYDHASKPVRLQMTKTRNIVRFTLRDYGKSCRPQKIRSRNLKDIRPGGVGVHIIRQAFDKVEYLPQSRGTKLVLEKDLPE